MTSIEILFGLTRYTILSDFTVDAIEKEMSHCISTGGSYWITDTSGTLWVIPKHVYETSIIRVNGNVNEDS